MARRGIFDGDSYQMTGPHRDRPRRRRPAHRRQAGVTKRAVRPLRSFERSRREIPITIFGLATGTCRLDGNRPAVGRPPGRVELACQVRRSACDRCATVRTSDTTSEVRLKPDATYGVDGNGKSTRSRRLGVRTQTSVVPSGERSDRRVAASDVKRVTRRLIDRACTGRCTAPRSGEARADSKINHAAAGSHGRSEIPGGETHGRGPSSARRCSAGKSWGVSTE